MAGKLVQNAHVNLTLNASQANKMLSDQTKLVKKLNEDLTDLVNNNGDPKAIEKLKKELKEAENLLKQLKTESAQTADILKRLDKASPKELNKALNQLRRELNKIERGSAAWNAHMEKIRRVKAEIAACNAQMVPQGSLLQRLSAKFNEYAGAVMAAAGALGGLVLAGKSAVKEFAAMDEAMANTQKFTGMSVEQVRDLNEEFKKMDTRTARDKLNDLAQEAGRLGKTSKEEVMGYVKAADILNVALSDLGEGATQKIAKLSNIFGIEDTEGTYNAMVKIGSVVNVLSQNCTASKPYLVEFANRLAGVGNQAGISIQQIIGLGAVLDANAQKVEASATAISQVLTRMYVDPAKYAKTAGLDVAEFTKLLKSDANEALLLFLDTLNKAGNMDVLAPMFKDMGESGARAIAAMSTLAKHIEEVRWQQQNANEAFDEGTSVLHEYEIFNNTAQASLDKAKKRINELAIELGEKLMPVMAHITSSGTMTLELLNKLVDFVKEYWKVLVALTASIATYSVVTNFATIKTKAFSAAQTIATGAMNAFRAAQFLVIAAYELLNGKVNMARRSIVAFGNAIKVNPLGLLVSVATAAAGALWALNDKTKKAKEEMEAFKKGIKEVDNAAAQYASQEIERLDRLYKVATDEKKSRDARLDAVKDLQKHFPAYFADLDTEIILAGQAKEKYDELRVSILNAAKARAAQDKISDNSRQLIDLELRKNQLDAEIADLNNKRVKAQADFYDMQDMGSPSGFNAHYSGSELQEIDKGLKERNAELEENIEKTKALTDANNDLYNSYVKTVSGPNPGDADDEEKDGGDEPYTPGMSDKERKAALKKAKEEFKQGLNDIMALRNSSQAQALALYVAGKINYLEFIEAKKQADEKYFDDSLKFYEDNLKSIKGYNVEEDKDYQALLLKKTENLQKYQNDIIAYNAEGIRRQGKWELQELEAQYAQLQNKTIVDEIALQEERLKIKVKYLEAERDLYNQGSKEWIELNLKIEDLVEQDRLDKESAFAKAKYQIEKEFMIKAENERFKAQRKALEFLKEQGRITVEEFEMLMKKIDRAEQKDLLKRKNSLPGVTDSMSRSDKNLQAMNNYNDQIAQLDEALEQGLITEKEYSKAAQKCQQEMISTFTEGLKNCGSEWVGLLTSMGEAWYNFAQSLEDGDVFGGLSGALEATVATMGAVFSQVTQFIEAETKIQAAAIEKRYDKEISLAQGNSRMVASLEKKKEKEVAKVKEDAAKKEMAMQVIMAIAQTATAALNAYSSAAAIPMVGHILAPIAAATAVAAGMIQVAAIKKQQEAASAEGYAEGGYTPAGAKYDVAGVVHKGEWVASQKLLRSPVTAPIIEMLDKAQRNNSVASLSLADSNYFAGAASTMPALQTQNPPQVIVNVPENSDSQTLSSLNLAIASLVNRLNQPFVTVNTMEGDTGIKRAQDDYNRYQRNRSNR